MRLKCVREVRDRITREVYEKDRVYEVEQPRADELLNSIFFEMVSESGSPVVAELVISSGNVEDAVKVVASEAVKNLSDCGVAELKVKAKQMGVAFNSRSTKTELIEAIEAKQELDVVFEEGN